jgi:hypothetical protein
MQFDLNLTETELGEHINDLRNLLGGELANRVAAELESQRPVPLPTKRGAIVRTDLGVGVLADPDDEALPWLLSRPEDPEYYWKASPGKVLEVLFEGYDA